MGGGGGVDFSPALKQDIDNKLPVEQITGFAAILYTTSLFRNYNIVLLYFYPKIAVRFFPPYPKIMPLSNAIYTYIGQTRG